MAFYEFLKNLKVDEKDKKEAENLIEELKKNLDANDMEKVKETKEKLNEKAMALATKVYEEAAKNNQSADNANNTDSNSKDNVKDAEYEEK